MIILQVIQGIMRYSLPIAAIALMISSCGGEAPAPGPAKVSVVEVMRMDLPVYREFVGEVRGLYDIPVRARVDGYLEVVSFEEGSKVDKGQLLYVIDAQPYEAEVAGKQSEVAEARTILVRTQNDLKRIKPLAEINAVSQLDLDAAIAEEGAAKASLEAAQANLEIARINLGYTRIQSPIFGIIGKTKAKTGEYVGKEPNPVILNTISRIDTVLVQFFITEDQYLNLARAYLLESDTDKVSREKKLEAFELELILSDGSVHDKRGHLDFIDRNVDPGTGSMLVQASFPNPSGLVRPGQFARVRAKVMTEKDAKLIPLRAGVDIQGKLNVYVLTDSNTVSLREVETGIKSGDLLHIKSGLEHGEKVVIEGHQKVRSGTPVVAETVSFESKSGKALK